MITLVLALIAVSFLQISVTYRHAWFYKKTGFAKLLLISLLFAGMNTMMGAIAGLLSEQFRGSMFFGDIYAALTILLILAFKAYFTTRRSKIADNVFDVSSFSVLFMLALATSFEVFIAFIGVGFLDIPLDVLIISVAAASLVSSLLGLIAGRRPNKLKSIRVFIFLASVFYLAAALSTIYYLL
jgi:putative Mn2+ efflux pump MntP